MTVLWACSVGLLVAEVHALCYCASRHSPPPSPPTLQSSEHHSADEGYVFREALRTEGCLAELRRAVT